MGPNLGPLVKPKKMTKRETELARVVDATLTGVAELDGAALDALSDFYWKRSWRWTIAAGVFILAEFFTTGGVNMLVATMAWLCMCRDALAWGQARAYTQVAASLDVAGDRVRALEEKRNERL